MKNYPTILWANDALKKGSFSFVCDENLMRLRHELSDFCEEAYIEYAVLREKDGFRALSAGRRPFLLGSGGYCRKYADAAYE